MNQTLKNLGLATLVVGSLTACQKNTADITVDPAYEQKAQAREEKNRQEMAVATDFGLSPYARGILPGVIVKESKYTQSNGYALVIDTSSGRFAASVVECGYSDAPRLNALDLSIDIGSRVNFATLDASNSYNTKSLFNAARMGTINTCYIAPALQKE